MLKSNLLWRSPTFAVILAVALVLAGYAPGQPFPQPVAAEPVASTAEAPGPQAGMADLTARWGKMQARYRAGASAAETMGMMQGMMGQMQGMMGQTMPMTGTLPMTGTMPMGDQMGMGQMMSMMGMMMSMMGMMQGMMGQTMPMTGTLPMTGTMPMGGQMGMGEMMGQMMGMMQGMMMGQMGMIGAESSAGATPNASQAAPEAIPAPDLTRSAEAGGVTVKVTPLNLHDTDAATLDFTVALDTHSVELAMDLATMAVLRIGNVEVAASGWEAPSGGHHVEGTLRFPAQDEAGKLFLADTDTVTLVIRDLAGVVERTFTWGWPP